MGSVREALVECIKRPGYTSVWSRKMGKYVCKRDAEYNDALQNQTPDVLEAHPPITDVWKWAFIAAVSGTVFFTLICVGLNLWHRGEPPSATIKLIDGFFGMANLAFGAIVGLLGGQRLSASKRR